MIARTWKLVPVLLAVCVAVSGGVLTLSEPASAKFVAEGHFGEAGSGDRQFRVPFGIATEQSTGDIFVADEGNARVQVFGAEGEFVSQFDGVEIAADGNKFTEATGVAVDNSTGPSGGDVYVSAAASGAVDKFRPKGPSPAEGYEYVCQLIGPGGGCHVNPVLENITPTEPFKRPTGVAVDAEGDLYVAQETGFVEEFDAEGNYVAVLGPKFSGAFSVAVNASGSAVYVTNLFEDVTKLTVEPVLHEVTESEVLDAGGSTAVAVNQATGEVFVDDSQPSSHISDYEAAAKTGTKPVEEFSAEEAGELSVGVTYSSHGVGTVYTTDIGNNDVHIFARQKAGVPAVKCEPASEIHATSAKLACQVDPESAETEVLFELEEVGQHEFAKTPYEKKIAGPEEAGVTIRGLKPETEYVYRATASNSDGATASKPLVAFTTVKSVPGSLACGASSISPEGAALEASVEPDELTRYQFEYGHTTAYGLKSAIGELVAGEVVAKATVGNLEPNATYDCRLVATAEVEGTSAGPNGSFKTPAVPPVVEESASLAPRVTAKAALLEGTVNPENNATTYHFVYLDEAEYQAAVQKHVANPDLSGVSTPELTAGGGFGPQAVEAPRLSGLEPETTYHFALVAVNGAGEGIGPDQTFKTTSLTPPIISDEGMSAVTSTSAMIAGIVDPQGLQTSYQIELGESAAVSTEAAVSRYYGVAFGDVALGAGGEAVTARFGNLAPGTTYRYRITATNEDGTVSGVGQGFTTLAIPLPAMSPTSTPLLATPSIKFPTEIGVVFKGPIKKKKSHTIKQRGGGHRGRRAMKRTPRGKRASKGKNHG